MVSQFALPAIDVVDGMSDLSLDSTGQPELSLAFIDLRSLGADPDVAHIARCAERLKDRSIIAVGCCDGEQIPALDRLVQRLSLTLVSGFANAVLPSPYVACSDLEGSQQRIVATVEASPRASLLLDRLVHASPGITVWDALTAESLAYSMLLAGPEFARWLSGQPHREPVTPPRDVVDVSRDNDTLRLRLRWPERRNSMNRWMRDALCESLDLARLDPTIQCLSLTAEGPTFSSGGDLAEFGTQRDIGAAHLIRMQRSVGWRLHELADRVCVDVHGSCIGAGVELPAFAGRVRAPADTTFRLPELAMGLIPGAGGTVSLPRRIGPWRTAWLALTGASLDAATARDWGLVDEVCR